MAFVHTNPVSYSASTTITRPNDTTAYTAGDVVGGAIEFKNMGPANDRETRVDGARVTITATRFAVHVTSIPAGMTSFRLHLYSATPRAHWPTTLLGTCLPATAPVISDTSIWEALPTLARLFGCSKTN